jgi:alpha-L-fucosidase
MPPIQCKADYETQLAETRDHRMKWWREARFGLFVHYGLFTQRANHEWVMANEGIPVSEYEKLADTFSPKEGCAREWAQLAKAAGMKYMVLTTRHHEGFSLWDSKVNPYNSVNLGPKRDLVREFVDACREFDLRIGFYSTLMEWHHPDSYRCAYDTEARKRFTEYIEALNTELLTNYGKIDVLWYDVPNPMESWEGWDSLERNQRLRALQPELIINNRSRLDEDFGTPEGHVKPENRDWEACMTFNDISWGYLDPEKAAPYSYSPQRILKMLNKTCWAGGNLLLNIGPAPDGSVPSDAVEPLTTVGNWLKQHGEAVYGPQTRSSYGRCGAGIGASASGKNVYIWKWIWPDTGSLMLTGFGGDLKRVTLLSDGNDVDFEHVEFRILLKGLSQTSPEPVANLAVFKLEFAENPEFHANAYYPQLNRGQTFGVVPGTDS